MKKSILISLVIIIGAVGFPVCSTARQIEYKPCLADLQEIFPPKFYAQSQISVYCTANVPIATINAKEFSS